MASYSVAIIFAWAGPWGEKIFEARLWRGAGGLALGCFWIDEFLSFAPRLTKQRWGE